MRGRRGGRAPLLHRTTGWFCPWGWRCGFGSWIFSYKEGYPRQVSRVSIPTAVPLTQRAKPAIPFPSVLFLRRCCVLGGTGFGSVLYSKSLTSRKGPRICPSCQWGWTGIRQHQAFQPVQGWGSGGEHRQSYGMAPTEIRGGTFAEQ